MINVTPTTSNKAASGRGTRSASSLRAAGDNMTPTMKAVVTGSRTSRPTYRTKPIAIVARIASDQVEISRRGSRGSRSGISRTRATARGRRPSRNSASFSLAGARSIWQRTRRVRERHPSPRAGRMQATYLQSFGSPAPCGKGTETRSWSGRRPRRSLSPNSSLSLVRALLRRLLMVPISTPQMAAASS